MHSASLHLSLLFLLVIFPMAGFVGFLFWRRACRSRDFRLPFEEMRRPAGWSLQNRADELMDDFTAKFFGGILSGLALLVMTQAQVIHAAMAVIIGIPVIAVTFFWAYRDLRRFTNHRLGLRGEQVVGHVLDRLSSENLHVFHDLPASVPGHRLGNIDHVVLSPAGVFVIETKTRRKPRKPGKDGRPGHKLTFDGKQLHFPEPMGTDSHGLSQARRNADWLAAELSADNASPITVHAALVFPGWWVDSTGKGKVTAINEKQLKSYLTGRPSVLPTQMMNALRSQLEKRCRIDFAAS